MNTISRLRSVGRPGVVYSLKRLSKLSDILIIVLLLSNSFVFGQVTDTSQSKHQRKKVERPARRNVVWFTPTRANTINGIALGTLPSSMFYHNDSLQIRGIHIEANPIMFYLVPHVVFASLSSPFIKTDSTKYFTNAFPDSARFKYKNRIWGLNIGILGSAEMNDYNGISISSVGTFGRSLKGISITFGQNNLYEFQGLLIAGLMNNVTKGSGLQIGLFNRCKECKGVQIGLLNTMAKRTLPVINVRL
jgi:hypothetical protein